MITVWLHPNISRFSDAPPERIFEGDSGASVSEILRAVFGDDKSLYFRIVDETGEIRRHINVYVGNSHIRELGGAGAIVPDNSQIQIITAVSGG